MDTKQPRSEYYANIQQCMAQATLREFGLALAEIAPAPVRAKVAKRTMFGYIKALFSSILKG